MPFATFEDTQTLVNQAKQMFRNGQVAQAVHFLELKTKQRPTDAELISNLSTLYRQIGNIDKAIETGRIALKQNPDNIDYITNLGTFYELKNDLLTAAKYYEQALGRDPENVMTSCNLVNIYERLGHLDECKDILEKVPEDKKQDAYYIITCARIKRHRKKFDEAKKMLLSLKDTSISSPRHKILKYNELARLCDALKDYQQAFKYAGTSKDILRQQPDAKRHPPGEILTLLQNLKSIFTREWVENWRPAPQPARPAPVQVVGFPRSGTTLIDQILQAHPSIAGMEEQPPTEWLMGAIDQAVKGVFKNIGELPDEQISSLQNMYFDSCRQFINFDDSQILLDKNPFSIYKIGPMLRVFPKMKTIIMLRHPLDCILSSYMQNFVLHRGTAALTSLESAAHYYDQSFALLEQYQQVCPTASFYMVRYEDLVENPKEEIKDLLEFLDLPWDEGVLRFHENEDKDIVTSASYAQVNQPLYKSALYRWKNYEKELAPIKPLLQPWIEKFGYENV